MQVNHPKNCANPANRLLWIDHGYLVQPVQGGLRVHHAGQYFHVAGYFDPMPLGDGDRVGQKGGGSPEHDDRF